MRAQVDVWHASVRAGDDELRAMQAMLTASEVARMARLRTPSLQRRFAVAHAFLRGVLSDRTGIAAERLVFERGPAGKPRLVDREWAPVGIEFNLSHAGDHALCAVAEGVEVGVDIEWIDARIDPEEVAASFFAPRELNELRSLDPRARHRAFFTVWTRKEALVKGLGTGLSTPLDAFAVPVHPDVPPRVAWAGPPPEGSWTLVDLAPPEGYTACLAAHAAEVRVTGREWAVSPRAADPSAA
jgi:4'-phosphopantetheinyl transferase